MLFLCVMCFFFFKQKTAYEMRTSDWSSDVCSSDLDVHLVAGDETQEARAAARLGRRELQRHHDLALLEHVPPGSGAEVLDGDEIGRASCRERVCQYV